MNLLLALSLAGTAKLPIQAQGSSGGPLRFEQAVFDVRSYDVALSIDPGAKSISGTTSMVARTVIPTNVILLDLDATYRVSEVTDDAGRPLRFDRAKDTIRIWFSNSKQPGDVIRTSINYSGVPQVSARAPWTDGFVWSRTADGSPWISVTLEGDGADRLFPVKDHPSDRPDSATMRLTVPDPLVAVGPGRLEDVRKNRDGTRTYDWRMSLPISNYSIVFNVAPYRTIHDATRSVDGTRIPIRFDVLPEDYGKGARLIEEFKKYLAFYEGVLGPYPYRSQKLGLVQSTHLGMEHSTAIAYGNKFRYDEAGVDSLLLHEFGHEWWGNLIGAADWKDFWIHEGFQTYMDSLYREHRLGRKAYLDSMRERRKGIKNVQAVAPRESKTSYETYNLEPDFVDGNPDIYEKGALILHSLRHLIGDDAFFRSLRRFTYPNRTWERSTKAAAARLVTTDDFITIAERESGRELDWFFDLYLRQPKLPRLRTERSGDFWRLSWETPDDLPFPMPIDVEVNGARRRIELRGGTAVVPDDGRPLVVDPEGWVLRAD